MYFLPMIPCTIMYIIACKLSHLTTIDWNWEALYHMSSGHWNYNGKHHYNNWQPTMLYMYIDLSS